MKLGFTGTRHGMDPDQYARVHDLVQLAIELSESRVEPFEAHHGDCIGADEEFHHLVLGFGSFVSSIVIHPPKDTKLRAYCQGDVILPPKDYKERNQDIVDASDWIVAAPPTEQPQPRGGTWSTIRFAQTKGNLWKVVLPFGVVVNS